MIIRCLYSAHALTRSKRRMWCWLLARVSTSLLAVDGHEIMNMSRQAIPSFTPGARLNPGPNGCMGVGLPFGVGAKAAAPDRMVVVLHGDGSLGLNLMELDTAVRNQLPVLVVVSN